MYEKHVGDRVQDSEGDISVIARIGEDGRIYTDMGWSYWPYELVVLDPDETEDG